MEAEEPKDSLTPSGTDPSHSPDRTDHSLLEVNANVIPEGLQNLLSCKKSVSWGGDGKDARADADENQDPGEEGNQGDQPLSVETAPKKKKKKSKSKGRRGLNAPTGFEEYYVDAPVTPEEYVEEKSVYDPSNTFSQRIETAIQRYIARRKLDSERKDLFDKYMTYGGVDSGPKMFGGGLDQKTLEESNAAEIAQFTATNYVGEDKSDLRSKNFVVDFDGVVKGFLSSRLPQVFSVDSLEVIQSHTNIIRNFLNYILHHDVCPEHTASINAARATCDLATTELWLITQACRSLPGAFNKACSAVFGGYYANTYIGDQEWAKGMDIDKGMSVDEARRVFLAGLAAMAETEVLAKYQKHVKKSKTRVTEVVKGSWEVTDLESPNPEVLKYYASNEGPVKGLQPLGRMRVQTWVNPNNAPDDLTEEEELELLKTPKETKTYWLWVEDDLLAKMFVGMKLSAHIRKLSFGVYYFDTVTQVYCSFYQLLPNEQMLGWREHKYLPPRGRMERAEDQVFVVPGEEAKELEIARANQANIGDGAEEIVEAQKKDVADGGQEMANGEAPRRNPEEYELGEDIYVEDD